jgi:hypothetical protein
MSPASAAKRPRLAITGGSIVGLIAGNLFHRLGWDVHIFERTAGVMEGRGAFRERLVSGFRGQSGYLLASYCHAPVLKRLLGSYFSLRARRRLRVSCGNTPSISASLSGIALFRYVVT